MCLLHVYTNQMQTEKATYFQGDFQYFWWDVMHKDEQKLTDETLQLVLTMKRAVAIKRQLTAPATHVSKGT